MDMMKVRRRMMLSMASGSILNSIMEVKHIAHLDTNARELQIPYCGYGVYYIVAQPFITGQDATDANLNDVLHSCAFMIWGNNGAKAFQNGPTFLYDKSGLIDYWSTIPLSFVDEEKTIISVKFGNGNGNFLGNHDYYVLMSKES